MYEYYLDRKDIMLIGLMINKGAAKSSLGWAGIKTWVLVHYTLLKCFN